MDKHFPKHPKKNEGKTVDFDEETSLWGIFGVDSGFCYGTYSSEEQANEAMPPSLLISKRMSDAIDADDSLWSPQ